MTKYEKAVLNLQQEHFKKEYKRKLLQFFISLIVAIAGSIVFFISVDIQKLIEGKSKHNIEKAAFIGELRPKPHVDCLAYHQQISNSIEVKCEITNRGKYQISYLKPLLRLGSLKDGYVQQHDKKNLISHVEYLTTGSVAGESYTNHYFTIFLNEALAEADLAQTIFNLYFVFKTDELVMKLGRELLIPPLKENDLATIESLNYLTTLKIMKCNNNDEKLLCKAIGVVQ